jgi:hypothetical protein
MDDRISEASERLAATCEQTLQRLDEVEVKLSARPCTREFVSFCIELCWSPVGL